MTIQQPPPKSSPSASAPGIFVDVAYLKRLILYLHESRLEQGISVKKLASRAGIRESAIHDAEMNGVVPPVSDFKAWTLGLGLSWQGVWTDSCSETTR